MKNPFRLRYPSSRAKRWVDGAVIYQIYPRSFQDSNDDGIGDLPGITSRLDYLKGLGVNGIWISPFYPSPMADFGYDVADYCDVDPLFGTLEDFKILLEQAHQRNIKVIIDIVPNHSSDEHEWFIQSKQSRTNKYSDWYVWHDPAGFSADGTPKVPNNWLGMFSGKSAWEWVPQRKQFYLHTFHTRQPDLNWQNPEVREAMKEVLRYWLRLGVDGFRVDAVPYLAKDPEFHDNPRSEHYNPKHDPPYYAFKHTNSSYWPKMYEYLNEMSGVLKEQEFAQHLRFMVTEGYVERDAVISNYLRYYQSMDPAVAAPFNFEGVSRSFSARDWRAFLHDFHETLDGFNPLAAASYAFGNHDQSRLVSRYGDVRARSVAVMQLTLPGMIFVYQGEELGMHDVAIPAALIQDPAANGNDGRDPERTPMQWSDEPYAGFSNTTPWLPVAHDYRKENVNSLAKDPKSFLSLYRRLLELRNNSGALQHGKLTVHEEASSHILAFTRRSGRESYTTVVNFDDAPTPYVLGHRGRLVVSSIEVTPEKSPARAVFTLKPHEAIVIKDL